MAELFYKISQSEADSIGKFGIDACTDVDPYCGKQTDGSWTIEKDVVDLYSDRPEIQSVDFASKTAVPSTELDYEPQPDHSA